MNKICLVLFLLMIGQSLLAQHWIDYSVTPRGDTINRIDKQKFKQGPWSFHYEQVRGEPGFDEEGYFVDDKKEGVWKKYSLMGDLIANEFYKFGYRDGKQQYYTVLGDLLREESWKAVNPKNPYDTILVPDLDHPDIMVEKIIKHEAAEVKNGTWTYYNSSTGAVAKTEKFIFGQVDKGQITNLDSNRKITSNKDPLPPVKQIPKEVKQWNKTKKPKGGG